MRQSLSGANLRSDLAYKNVEPFNPQIEARVCSQTVQLNQSPLARASYNASFVFPVDCRLLDIIVENRVAWDNWQSRLSVGDADPDGYVAASKLGAEPATGYFALTGLPTADDTITVNGVVFTWKASGATGNQINIGADEAETIDNAVEVLNASLDADVAVATYSNVDDEQIFVRHDTGGTAGNSFTLAESTSNLTRSAATLANGAAGIGTGVFSHAHGSMPGSPAYEGTLKRYAAGEKIDVLVEAAGTGVGAGLTDITVVYAADPPSYIPVVEA